MDYQKEYVNLRDTVLRFLRKDLAFQDLRAAVREPCPICGLLNEEAMDTTRHVCQGHAVKVASVEEANIVLDHTHPTGGVVHTEYFFSPEEGEKLEIVSHNLQVAKKADRARII